MLPKISIVTPSFHQGRFIERRFCPFLNQRYEPLEYIVADGGSADESYVAFWGCLRKLTSNGSQS